jgi:Transposase, Mutator family
MALDKDALSELLDALRSGGDLDLVRSGLQLVLQALIELEAAQRIGAEPYQRSPERSTHRNGSASAPSRPRPATCSCTSPSCDPDRSFPRCWSRAGGSTGPCGRW